MRHLDPLGESMDELHAMAPCGYLSMRPCGTIVRANERLARMTGRGVDQLVGKVRLHDLLSIGSQIYFETHIDPLLHMQGFVDQVAIDLRGPEGDVPALINAVVRPDDAGRSKFIDAIIVDATERRRYEREILASRNQAEEAARVKGELVSMVSHDIRSPAAAIATVGELLERTELSSDQAKLIRILRSSTSTLLGLIDDVLDYGRLEAGRMNLERKPFDMQALIQGIVEELRIQAERKGVILAAEIDNRLPSPLFGDRIKLGRVLNNLLGNGIKFTEQGSVTLQARVTGIDAEQAVVRIDVRDSGIGIPPEQMARIFENFSQGGDDIGSRYGGNGLGLGICKRLLELHDSTLHVESEVGHGSRFFFTLRLDLA